MLSGKQRAIEDLRKRFREARIRAQELGRKAATESNADLALQYRRQAHFEYDKAKGYLKHAKILAESGPVESESDFGAAWRSVSRCPPPKWSAPTSPRGAADY